MKKIPLSQRKSQLSRDFDETLQTMIRSLSREEINLIEAYGNSEERKDFYDPVDVDSSTRRNNTRQSILRHKSFNKYEVVVDGIGGKLKNNVSIEYESPEPKIFTRPILQVKAETKDKKKPNITSKYIQRFFPSFKNLNEPFPRTSVKSLPYQLQIEIEGSKKLIVQVTEFHTINKIKEKIRKKENIDVDHQALFYKEKRLEGSNNLYSYGIGSNSHVQLSLCKLITIHGTFNLKKFIFTIYTSVTVEKLKNKISKKISSTPLDIELKYKGSTLDDDKELFIYNVLDNSEIEIVLSDQSDAALESVGYKTVENFFKMTDNLTKCKCYALRIDAMVEIFKLSLENSSTEQRNKINRLQDFLEEFSKGENLHHNSCFKLKKSPKDGVILSDHSSVSITSFSGSENSLECSVHAENIRAETFGRIKIEPNYIKLLAEAEDFQIFKHLLSDKIGIICDLRSVALLFRYSREIVRYIGWDGKENNHEIDRTIYFTKLYFQKYFQKDIVDKGGLEALTLSDSYLD